MGNIMKKETPLEKSKREADKQRAAQLKAKRRNTAREVRCCRRHPPDPPLLASCRPPACRLTLSAPPPPQLPPQWDPSGTGEQGPGIVNHEEEAAPQAGSQGGKDPNRVTSSCCT